MKPGSLSVTDARAIIDRESRAEEPYRTALNVVSSALDTAKALSVIAFGDAATPDHALVLLDHLLAQADRVEVHGSDYDDESE